MVLVAKINEWRCFFKLWCWNEKYENDGCGEVSKKWFCEDINLVIKKKKINKQKEKYFKSMF